MKAIPSIAIILVTLAAALNATASVPTDSLETPDILQRQMRAESKEINFVTAPYQSPAMRQFRLPFTFGTAGAGWKGDYLSSPVDPQAGSGEQYGFFNADAEVKYSTSTLWGGATYTNGIIRDVLYNETSDLDLIYPYVTADEVGGDIRAERYAFSGGYADCRGRLAWGASLSYVAGLYYRNVDPRPRNTTGRLDISAGIAMRVFHDYFIGVAGAYRKYRQTCDLEFMSELGDAKVYHLTGLGNHYERFTGTGYSNYYNGDRFSGRISIVPASRRGLTIDAEVSRFTFDHILKDLNRLPMASVWHNEMDLHASWRGVSGTIAYGIKGEGRFYRRHGTENIFGDAVTGTYPQIGSLEMYADNLKQASAALFFEHSSQSIIWSIEPAWRYTHRSQIYAMPAMQAKDINGQAGVTASISTLRFSGWYAGLSANYSATYEATVMPVHAFSSQLSLSRKITSLHAVGLLLSYIHTDYHHGPIANGGSATLRFLF